MGNQLNNSKPAEPSHVHPDSSFQKHNEIQSNVLEDDSPFYPYVSEFQPTLQPSSYPPPPSFCPPSTSSSSLPPPASLPPLSYLPSPSSILPHSLFSASTNVPPSSTFPSLPSSSHPPAPSYHHPNSSYVAPSFSPSNPSYLPPSSSISSYSYSSPPLITPSSSNLANDLENILQSLSHPNLLPLSVFPPERAISLAEILQTRRPSKLFADLDLKVMVSQLIEVLSFLQNKNIVHGDLSISTIYFSPSSALFQVYPSFSSSSSFLLAAQRSKKALLSPELLSLLPPSSYSFASFSSFPTTSSFLPPPPSSASDVWSLGLVLLEIATLLPSEECLDFERRQVKLENLKERLGFVEKYFSKEIREIFGLMLRTDKDQRPDFIHLKEMWNIIITKQQKEKRKKSVDVDHNISDSLDSLRQHNKTITSEIQRKELRSKQLSYHLPSPIPPPSSSNSHPPSVIPSLPPSSGLLPSSVSPPPLPPKKKNLQNLIVEIENSKKLIEEYVNVKKDRRGLQSERKALNEVGNHQKLLERNKALEDRLQSVMMRSQELTKTMKKGD